MILLALGVILFLIAIFFVIYIVMQKEKPEERRPTIHASGIYSIVRRSPRQGIESVKPKVDEIRDFLSKTGVDAKGRTLSFQQKEQLLADWEKTLEINIQTVEAGDKNGVEIYFYHNQSCSQNQAWSGNNKYITREELYQHPELLPPFHVGCSCLLLADTEWKKGENVKDAAPVLESGKNLNINWRIIEGK
jgi:hypothetical protein